LIGDNYIQLHADKSFDSVNHDPVSAARDVEVSLDTNATHKCKACYGECVTRNASKLRVQSPCSTCSNM